MDILGSVGAIEALADAAKSIFQPREVKVIHEGAPKPQAPSFADTLNAQLQTEQAAAKRANQYVARFDSDGDGLLNAEELGMTREAFAKLDADGNGKLDQQELKNAFLGKTGTAK